MSKPKIRKAVTLRDYQTRAIDDVFAEIAAGRRRVLLVAPTGAGKTVMFAEIARRFVAEGKTVAVFTHRKELNDQGVRKLHAAGVGRVGVWRGQKHSRDTDAPVVVVAIQALRSAKIPADLVIVDEAHHATAPSWRELLDLYPDAVHLGATATPWRSDGKGLGHYFQALVTATTVRDLTDAGHLARVRMFTHPHTLRDLDLRGVKTSGGDYQTAALAARVDRPTLLGDIVAHWTTHANGARSLVFAASVEHSQHIVARFRAAGITAEHLDGKTPEAERDAMLARLHAGTTRVVSNYNVLTEGFDAPSVGCVILARPTQRLGVYLQAVGRGLRVEAEKPSVVVLDHAGLCLRFGVPDEEHPCSLEALDEPERDGTPRVRRCPECGLCVPIATRVCPECAEVMGGGREVPTEEPTGALVEVQRPHEDVKTITVHGVEMTIPQYAAIRGLNPATVYTALRDGKSIEELASISPRPERKLTFKKWSYTIVEWSRITGISKNTIKTRWRRGEDAERILAPWSRSQAANQTVRCLLVAMRRKERANRTITQLIETDPESIRKSICRGGTLEERPKGFRLRLFVNGVRYFEQFERREDAEQLRTRLVEMRTR